MLLFVMTRGWACSCIPNYTPICETITNARKGPFKICKVQVVQQSEKGISVNILEDLIGKTNQESIFLKRGNGANCGVFTDQYQVGEQLILNLPLNDTTSQYLPFECAYNFSILKIRGNQFLYPSETYGQFTSYPITDLTHPVQCGLAPEKPNVLELKVYPIPSNRYLNISGAEAINKVEAVVFYNMNGQQLAVQHQLFNDGASILVDISLLPGGTYLMELVGDRVRQTMKIIKIE